MAFEDIPRYQLDRHLGVGKYGDFELTDAVRPSPRLTLKEGWRNDSYYDKETNTTVPVIMATASRKKLFRLFMELIKPLGEKVDVVIETSHNSEGVSGKHAHVDMYREGVDMPYLLSVAYEYEDLLLNDGCTGIAVLNPSVPQEVQFDERKLLTVYCEPLDAYRRILESFGVPYDEQIRFVIDDEHTHLSTNGYRDRFKSLQLDLGLDNFSGSSEEWWRKDKDDDLSGDWSIAS